MTLDTPISIPVVPSESIVHGYSSGPSFATAQGDTSFPWTFAPGSTSSSAWLLASEEGVRWMRGHVAEDSQDGLALLAASRLAP